MRESAKADLVVVSLAVDEMDWLEISDRDLALFVSERDEVCEAVLIRETVELAVPELEMVEVRIVVLDELTVALRL